MVKMSLFVKYDNFNIKNMDEFLETWVLTHQNSFISCKLKFLIHWTTHFNDFVRSKKFHKNYINPTRNFQLQNINFENIFLTMRIWLEIVFGLIKVIKPLPKTFLQRYYYEVFFIIHKIFLKIVKKRISTHLL